MKHYALFAALIAVVSCSSPQQTETTEPTQEMTQDASDQPTATESETTTEPSDAELPADDTEGVDPSAKLTAGKSTVTGMPKEVVARVFRQRRNSLLACYQVAVEEDEQAQGKVVLTFTINGDGSTSDENVTSELGSDDSEKCFKVLLEKMTFPKPDQESATASLLFNFRP